VQLVGFARLDLAPGQTRTAVFELHADLTSYTGRHGRRQVDPGPVELRVGASSVDIRATLAFTMTGRRREVGADRALQPTITVTG
jgi:beta-glucosidase